MNTQLEQVIFIVAYLSGIPKSKHFPGISCQRFKYPPLFSGIQWKDLRVFMAGSLSNEI